MIGSDQGPRPRNEFPTIVRVDARLTATGPFLPNRPIVVQAVGSARFDALAVEIDFVLLDDDPEAGRSPTPRTNLLQKWQGSLAAGGETPQLEATLTFPRPGYYRVAALVRNMPSESDVRRYRDSTIVDRIQRHLWILVDDDGGRLTRGFDSEAIPVGSVPLYGSYGPFVSAATSAQHLGDLGRFSEAEGYSYASSWNLADEDGSASLVVTGTFKYRDYDQVGAPLVGVPGARIQGFCYGTAPVPWAFITVTSGPNGDFLVNCPGNYTVAIGHVFLDNNYATVGGENGSMAGAILAAGGGTVPLIAANDYAARVFLDLTVRAPQMIAYAGYSKGKVDVWVSDSDLGYGIFWCSTPFLGCPGNDMILTNLGRVFNFDGLFVTTHEYAHGYHWHAIENWAFDAGACDTLHYWSQTSNLGCAFTEGVATWLTMAV
ncbi:MAG: hypothetical protein ACYC2K_05840, partial [Gemmatimonadales bacterium]